MTTINELYGDAISHCRWKSSLMTVLTSIKIEEYKNQTFETIFESIGVICDDVKGVGLLTMYDIVSAICFNHNIAIDRVYITGGGPKRAIRLLNMKARVHKIGKYRLNYVSPNDVIDAFAKCGYKLDNNMKTEINGDVFETYICEWQKNIVS
jgi:hypothetical protein